MKTSPATIPLSLERCHVLSSDIRTTMAKADLRKSKTDWRSQIGNTVHASVARRGWSLKEFTSAVQRDERQCSRWMSGAERPQLDVLFAVEGLRHLIVVALSELLDEVVV